MKKRLEDFVSRQRSVFTFENEHSFYFVSKKNLIDTILLVLIYVTVVFFVIQLFDQNSVSSMYMIILITVPGLIYALYTRVENKEIQSIRLDIFINKTIKFLFLFSATAMLLFNDMYAFAVPTILIGFNILLFLVSSILSYFIISPSNKKESRFTLFVFPLVVFVSYAAIVNVVNVESLEFEIFTIILIYFVVYAFRFMVKRSHIVWNVVYIIGYISFVLMIGFTFSNNKEHQIFINSNYFSFHETNYPEEFTQIIEKDDFTYILSDNSLFVYEDKELLERTYLGYKDKLLFIEDDIVYLKQLIEIESEDVYQTLIYELVGEEMDLKLDISTFYHSTIPTITEDFYYYITRWGELYQTDLKTGINQTVDVDNNDPQIMLESDSSIYYYDGEVRFIPAFTQYGRPICEECYTYSSTVYFVEEPDDLDGIRWFEATTFDEKYIYFNNGDNSYIYDKELKSYFDVLGNPVRYYDMNNIKVTYTMYSTLIFEYDDRVPAVIEIPKEGFSSQINVSNTNKLYYRGHEVQFSLNEDIVYYDMIPSSLNKYFVFISSFSFIVLYANIAIHDDKKYIAFLGFQNINIRSAYKKDNDKEDDWKFSSNDWKL